MTSIFKLLMHYVTDTEEYEQVSVTTRLRRKKQIEYSPHHKTALIG